MDKKEASTLSCKGTRGSGPQYSVCRGNTLLVYKLLLWSLDFILKINRKVFEGFYVAQGQNINSVFEI